MENSPKQGTVKVATAYDLERKYNLSNLTAVYKAVENNKLGLNRVNNELDNFVDKVGDAIEELQDQIDGTIMTWFYSGEPTLENEPAINWNTDELKIEHIGDLYYDKETGYAYRWTLDNETSVFSWIQIIDSDIAKSLAIANAAKDAADSKRRVFTETPTTPYDAGDIWLQSSINDEGVLIPGEMYRCRLGRGESETFNENDWIKATNYTDDSMATSVMENLNNNYLDRQTIEDNYPTYSYVAEIEDGLVASVTDTVKTTYIDPINGNIEILNTSNTTLTQKSDNWDMAFTKTQTLENSQQTLEKHIQFIDGKILLSSQGGQIMLRIENDRIAFVNNANVVIGYWTPTSFQLGNYAYIPRTNGSLDFKKVV